MCGRVVAKVDFPTIQRATKAKNSRRGGALRFSRSFNIGPGCFQAALVHTASPAAASAPIDQSSDSESDPTLTLTTMKWGIPRDRKTGKGTLVVNIRAETAVGKFGRLADTHRCVIVANGYYEWTRDDKKPHYIRPQGDGLLYLAGVYDLSNDGEPICAVITIEADRELSWIHDRMPGLVSAEGLSTWLDTEKTFVQAGGVIRGGGGTLDWYEVTDRVNKVGNDGEECCMRVEEYRERMKNKGIMKFFQLVEKRERTRDVGEGWDRGEGGGKKPKTEGKPMLKQKDYDNHTLV